MMHIKVAISIGLFVLLSHFSYSQNCYWQQHVNYKMDIDFNTESNQFTGKQILTYTNNSPDTLVNLFYHLYFNAFQPGSMMDVRSRTIEDPDRRVRDRIFKLKPEETGWHKIQSLKMNGKKVNFTIDETILQAKPIKPILPGESVKLEMEFQSQVPLQVRRSGRDNMEGIRYSMTQWYPKLCEYDKEGWHSNPYVGREFHGVFGNYDVTIHLDKTYTIGGTGVLSNPENVGHGYVKANADNIPKGDKLTWIFKAEKVHDFAWAADPDYTHVVSSVENGHTLHFIYQPDSNNTHWDSLPFYTTKLFEAMETRFGKYPYPQYTIIQGGDGGMEYPMTTLITGNRGKMSLIGLMVHEVIHSWYQGVLATNESKYPWMDEGFTSYASEIIMDAILGEQRSNPLLHSYLSYYALVESGKQEPLTTHADHFITNRGYGASSYSKGAIFLHQLEYVIGKESFRKGMLRYFNEWKFKHPTPDDFKRIMEKTSGLELDWYMEHWVGTVNTIDYEVSSVISNGKTTDVLLKRNGEMPMPLDVIVYNKNGEQDNYHIPLSLMRGIKKEAGEMNIKKAWPWVYPEYTLRIDLDFSEIQSIQIDPSGAMADVKPDNNIFPRNVDVRFKSE